MRFSKTATLAVLASTAKAQRPDDTSICDYYTTALLKENTADNQATLLTLLVNTVVIGNYTEPNVGVKVPGILAPGQYNGKDVNLLPYFTGDLASSNRGGDSGVSVNFLDGGAAEPLKKNKPADDESSNQYFLLTHLYQFFGSLLGCSQQGMPGFDAYDGFPSMYEVHKFMDLDPNEVGYFITQVGLAAASFGVAESDIKVVATALNSLFGYRCAPATTVIEAQGEQLQSICTDDTCPLAENAVCDDYASIPEPTSAVAGNSTSTSYNMPTPTGSGSTTTLSPHETTSATSSSATGIATAGAATHRYGLAAAAGGIAAFLL